MCVRMPNVTQPLLYLEDASVSSPQTHGGNPGLADSKGEPYEKWLWPTKFSDFLQHFTWSYFMGLAGFPFTNKIRVWGKGYCAKIHPREASETLIPNRYGHPCCSRQKYSAPRAGLVSGTLRVLVGSTHEHGLGGSLALWDHPVWNFSMAQNSFLTGKGTGLYRQ